MPKKKTSKATKAAPATGKSKQGKTNSKKKQKKIPKTMEEFQEALNEFIEEEKARAIEDIAELEESEIKETWEYDQMIREVMWVRAITGTWPWLHHTLSDFAPHFLFK